LPAASFRGLPVCLFTAQWDETSQRLRSIQKARLKGERVNQGQKHVQVMMQSGCWILDSGGRDTQKRPVIMRAAILEVCDSNHILEGLLRRLPFDVTDLGEMRAMAAKHDVVVVSWCADRASANFLVLDWLYKQMAVLPNNVWPHGEPCACHGIALVKGRSSSCKKIAGAAAGFAKLMRDSATENALRDTLIELVHNRLVRKYEPRPAILADRAEQLIQELYGSEDDEYLYRTTKSGERVAGPLLRVLRDLFKFVDLDPDSEDLIHWCSVIPGSPEDVVEKKKRWFPAPLLTGGILREDERGCSELVHGHVMGQPSLGQMDQHIKYVAAVRGGCCCKKVIAKDS